MARSQPTENNYRGGSYFKRARNQFQVLYEREGSFKRALERLDLILWPDINDEKGDPRRPPVHILQAWATDVDEGKADVPEKLRRAFNKRYDAYTEAIVREVVHENALTAKALAKQAREGKLDPSKSSLYMHANNGIGFLLREVIGKKVVGEEVKRVRGIKMIPAPKRKQLTEGATNAEFRVIT